MEFNKKYFVLYEISGVEVANIETGNLTGEEGNAQAIQKADAPIAAASPEQLYDVKINGQVIKVPLSELTNGYSRHQDYTQKTMKLAEERNEWTSREKEYQKQLTEVKQFFSDPRVQNALKNLQAGIVDPTQPLTPEQVLQLQRQEADRHQAMLDERMQQMSQELEVRQLAAHFNTEIESTVRQLLDKHQVLQDIDGIENLLREDVARRQPANLQEAKQLFAEAAQMRSDKIMTRFQTQQKEAAVQQAKLVKGGIEVGGNAPQIVPAEKKLKFGSADLFQAAVSDLMQSSLNK